MHHSFSGPGARWNPANLKVVCESNRGDSYCETQSCIAVRAIADYDLSGEGLRQMLILKLGNVARGTRSESTPSAFPCIFQLSVEGLVGGEPFQGSGDRVRAGREERHRPDQHVAHARESIPGLQPKETNTEG